MAPVNDSIHNAIRITSSGTVSGNSTGATTESTYEHDWFGDAPTVWYYYDNTGNSKNKSILITDITGDSGFASYNGVEIDWWIYPGPSKPTDLEDLDTVGSWKGYIQQPEYADQKPPPKILLIPPGYYAYIIVTNSYYDSAGEGHFTFTYTLYDPPVNDKLVDAIKIAAPTTISGSTIGAFRESDYEAGWQLGASVWYYYYNPRPTAVDLTITNITSNLLPVYDIHYSGQGVAIVTWTYPGPAKPTSLENLDTVGSQYGSVYNPPPDMGFDLGYGHNVPYTFTVPANHYLYMGVWDALWDRTECGDFTFTFDLSDLNIASMYFPRKHKSYTTRTHNTPVTSSAKWLRAKTDPTGNTSEYVYKWLNPGSSAGIPEVYVSLDIWRCAGVPVYASFLNAMDVYGGAGATYPITEPSADPNEPIGLGQLTSTADVLGINFNDPKWHPSIGPGGSISQDVSAAGSHTIKMHWKRSGNIWEFVVDGVTTDLSARTNVGGSNYFKQADLIMVGGWFGYDNDTIYVTNVKIGTTGWDSTDILEDNFSTGNFSKWSGTVSGSGGTLSVINSPDC